MDSEVRKGHGEEKRVLEKSRDHTQDQKVVQGSFWALFCFKSGRCDSGMALPIAYALNFQALSQWGQHFQSSQCLMSWRDQHVRMPCED